MIRMLTIVMLLLAVPFSSLGAEAIGTVVRKQGVAEVEPPRERQLVSGDSVLGGEVVRTGADGRLLFHLADETTLTLGGDTRFAFDASLLEESGVTLELFSGAFHLATGSADMTVVTPLATIGIRGTEFWGGYFQPGEFGVVLFSGHSITVTNEYGQVELAPGEGTTIFKDKPPSEPIVWGAARVQQAVQTVQFD